MNTTPPFDELATIAGRTKGYLLTEQTAHGAVNALAETIQNVVTAATGAGVSLISAVGRRESVGATDNRTLEADTLQYDLGEGPCLSAWSTGEPAYIADTRRDQAWTRWSAAAADTGVRSCLSVPLLLGEKSIGALKVYSDTPDAFTNDDRRLLASLARSAAALLGHIQASDTPQRINDDVKASLAGRDAVGMARGILMERFDLDRQAAMQHLLGLATDTRTTIAAMAATINERQEGLDPTRGV